MKSKFALNNRENQLAYLRVKFGDDVKATPCNNGVVNGMWSLEKSGGIIVRFYPTFFQNKLAVETWILPELKKIEAKTPELLELDTEGFITPVLFLSRLPGVAISETKQKLTFNESQSLFFNLKALLKKVAAINIEAVGYLHDPFKVSNISQYVESSMDNYLAIIRRENLLSSREINILQNDSFALQALLINRPPQLTYPDLSLGNILVHDAHFSGLIDWEFLMGFEPLFAFSNLLLNLFFEEEKHLNVECFFQNFPKAQWPEIILLSKFRLAELLSYLPTTKLYEDSIKQKQLCRYRRAFNSLLNISC